MVFILCFYVCLYAVYLWFFFFNCWMNRDMEELLSKKDEEELAIMSTTVSSVTSHYLEHDNLLTPLKVNLKVGPDFDQQKYFSWPSVYYFLQEMYIDLVNKKAKIEEQLMEISKSLCGMEVYKHDHLVLHVLLNNVKDHYNPNLPNDELSSYQIYYINLLTL